MAADRVVPRTKRGDSSRVQRAVSLADLPVERSQMITFCFDAAARRFGRKIDRQGSVGGCSKEIGPLVVDGALRDRRRWAR
jgi:hypothetical protein